MPKKVTMKEQVRLAKELSLAAKNLLGADVNQLSEKARHLKIAVVRFDKCQETNDTIDYEKMCQQELDNIKEIPMLSLASAGATNLPPRPYPTCCAGDPPDANGRCRHCGDKI